jgi:fibronectin type 3 domain-containing protein
MVKRLIFNIFSVCVAFFLFTLGCQNTVSDASDADPFQNQNKLPLEVPSDVSADYLRVSISTADGDSIVYFEKVQSNTIQVAVPSATSSKIVVDAYKGNTLVYSGLAIVDAGQQTSLSLIQQTTTRPVVPEAPVAPTVLLKNESIEITWQVSSGTIIYKIYRSSEDNENPVLIDSCQSAKYVDAAIAGTTVFYSISAVNATGESSRSDASSITVPKDEQPEDPHPPAVVQNVTATANGTSTIVITWNAVSGAVSYNIYRVNQSTLSSQKIGTTGTLTFSDVNIATGTTWGYSVSSVNSAGESSLSEMVVATTSLAKPSIPQNVAAAATSEKSITVTWGSVTGAASYKIEWAQKQQGPFTSATSAQTEYIIANLTASTQYYCRVTAVNSSGQSDPSELVSATTKEPALQPPSAPVLTAKSLSDTSIQITWLQVTSAVSYVIEQGNSSSGAFTPVCTTSTLTWIAIKLVSGTSYYFRAKATNSAGASSYSGIVSATTATSLSAPSGLKKDTATTKTITLKWQSVTGATSYKVYRSISGSGQYTAVGIATTTAFTDTGLNEATTYFYMVSSIKDTFESVKSTSLSVATSAAEPSTPTGLTATTASSSSITIKFTTVTGATGYKLYWSTDNKSFTDISITGNTYTHSGLTASTTYYYKVSAIKQSSESVQSSVVSATTSAAGPATPTGLTATVASSSSMTVKFTAVTGATGYKLYWSTNNTTFTAISLTSTTYTHTGLTANTTYYYKVSAVQQSNESAQSTVVSAKTSAASTKVAVISASKCVGCSKCVPKCKTGAIKRSGTKYVIDASLCDGDGACITACKHGAIALQ